MRYLVILMAALAVPASAQFSQLTATDDGNQVYFVSPLVLKGSTAAGEARLYRLGPDGLSLFAERGALAPKGTGSNLDGISGPQVSGDGSIVGFTLNNICPSADPCTQVQSDAVIRGTKNLDLGPGSLQLSRNGRWVLVIPGSMYVLADPQTGTPVPANATLIDLSTGERVSLSPPPQAMDGSAIASDGTVVLQQTGSIGGGAIGLWKQGQFTPIQSSAGTAIRVMALSDDASTLILSTVDVSKGAQTAPTLTARNLATGQDTPLFTSSPFPNLQLVKLMGLSNDGRRLLYRVETGTNSGPAYVSDTSTAAVTPIELPDGEMATAGTLSGAGDVVFLVTTKGRMVRVAPSTGVAETLIPATPFVSNVNPLPAGSFVRLHGPFQGSVEDWAGQFLLNDQPLPVLGVQDGEVDVQIPWEAHSGSASLRFVNPGESPFEASQTVYVVPIFITPEFAGPGTFLGLKMVKGDFSGLATAAPRPGDIVHLYMTGLGPVQVPVQTGAPAPLTGPDPIQGTITCRFQPQTSDSETLYAGLAPGMIGFYQVSLKVPADAGTAPVTGFSCQLQSVAGGGSFGIIGGLLGN
jgi:uncharacterized protein (TIGR03437 family)